MKSILKIEPNYDYYEPIWGVISTLRFHQICSVISKELDVEFTHQDIVDKAIRYAKVIDGNELLLFEKYIWFDDENDWLIEIIENKKTSNYQITDSQSSLFSNQKFQKSTTLLKEWKQVDYIVKVQGDIPFFNIDKIRNINGIQMILEESIENFVEYYKIL